MISHETCCSCYDVDVDDDVELGNMAESCDPGMGSSRTKNCDLGLGL